MAQSAKSTTKSTSTRIFANKTKVVRGLLTELVQGKWQTADRLTEAEACERFDVSRTPVREALFELQGLGLLEIRRNCGAVMLPFGPVELANIFAVRTLLEVEAARLAALKADPGEVAQLIKEFGELKEASGEKNFFDHDNRFHRFIAKSSENMSLAAEITRYKNLIQWMREIMDDVPKLLNSTIDEHISILELVRKKKSTEAAEAMQKHIGKAAESTIRTMNAFRKK